MWEGIHVLGMQSRDSGPARLGTAVHHATAIYDANREQMTARDAVSEFVDALHDKERGEVAWRDDLTPAAAERVGGALVNEYVRRWSPQFTFLSVEQKLPDLDMEINTPAGPVTVRWTGSMDRARVVRGTRAAAIVDIKTGKRAIEHGFAKTRGHAAQVGLYQVLANADPSMPVQVDETPHILAMSTSPATATKPQIAMAPVPGAVEQLLGAKGGDYGLMEYAALFLKTGMFPPNPRSQLCGEKYCPRWSVCKFRER